MYVRMTISTTLAGDPIAVQIGADARHFRDMPQKTSDLAQACNALIILDKSRLHF
jgi:hypothetical protein